MTQSDSGARQPTPGDRTGPTGHPTASPKQRKDKKLGDFFGTLFEFGTALHPTSIPGDRIPPGPLMEKEEILVTGYATQLTSTRLRVLQAGSDEQLSSRALLNFRTAEGAQSGADERPVELQFVFQLKEE